MMYISPLVFIFFYQKDFMVMYSCIFTYECVFYYVLGQRWPNKQVKSMYLPTTATASLCECIRKEKCVYFASCPYILKRHTIITTPNAFSIKRGAFNWISSFFLCGFYVARFSRFLWLSAFCCLTPALWLSWSNPNGHGLINMNFLYKATAK